MTMYNVPFGFKWAAKITNCVSTPVKDDSITPAWRFAVTYFNITVDNIIYTSNTKLERINVCFCSLFDENTYRKDHPSSVSWKSSYCCTNFGAKILSSADAENGRVMAPPTRILRVCRRLLLDTSLSSESDIRNFVEYLVDDVVWKAFARSSRRNKESNNLKVTIIFYKYQIPISLII